MLSPVFSIETNSTERLAIDFPSITKEQLENGKVVYYPNIDFPLTAAERALLTEKILNRKQKNISFDYTSQRIGGLSKLYTDKSELLQNFMLRYAKFAHHLIVNMAPAYEPFLKWGRTSYRPAEIKGRQTSKRKDDTRLHVDAFPSTPVHGLRILRVFNNINPYHEPRVWNLGESYSEVLNRFLDTVPPYSAVKAKLLNWAQATKTLRSPYDHYMLHLHDNMKLNESYQNSVSKHSFNFEASTTWVVFTDQVSHAALSGQYLLEQTFYVPIEAMYEPQQAPLCQLENKIGKRLLSA